MTRTGALLSKNRRFIPLGATILMFFLAYALGAVSYSGMRDPQVFLNLFRTSPFYIISAVGMTFVIISGGIDLSVSGMVALTTVASAALLRSGEWNAWVVILLMLAMGMAMGAIMGAFITYLKVQPFIATLAGMWIARGLCFIISDDAIAINNRVFRILGQTKLLIPGLSDPTTQQGAFISILVVLEFVVVAVAMYLAHYTRFGRTVYAIGGNEGRNEQSSRLMGLPVNSTKMLVYTLNGFCSALAGLTLAIYVSSGHGLYARGFELTIIASVVIGGTMLTGGSGYLFGTLFGVLITAVTQTLIQFNGSLSSWWTNIVVGLLTLLFIGVQSLLTGGKAARVSAAKAAEQAEGRGLSQAGGVLGAWRRLRARRGPIVLAGPGVIVVVVLAVLMINGAQGTGAGTATGTAPTAVSCELKPFREDQAAGLISGGAVVVYERNGGPQCIEELYGIYPDGRIVGDDGVQTIDKVIPADDVSRLLGAIADRGWFTDTMYDTWHTPCGQCYAYHLTVRRDGEQKTVQAVDGGTDAPADYWQVVSLINGVIPHFTQSP